MKTGRNIVIFLGPPGAGKGSLSNLCTETLNWVQLSTGNLCRKHIAEKTELGLQMDEIIRSGKLIEDQLIINMVNHWLLEQHHITNDSIILDGYPRTVAQAQALHEITQTKLPSFLLQVIKLSLSDEQVVTRLSSRAICQNKNCQAVYSSLPGSSLAPVKPTECNKCSSPLVRRNDDEVQSIRERLKTYYRHEQDLLDFYQKSGIAIQQVHVDKPLHEVFGEFKKLMGFQQ